MIKVVLADDEKKVVLLLQKLIDWEKQGFEIVGIANDGIHALELVREKQPQLLITDIRMPGCDGIELIRQARELQPGIHFVIISGYRQFEYAQNALKYGVEDYLLKPLKKDDLNGILLRVREKLGEEAALEYQLKKSDEQRQSMLLSRLKRDIERQEDFLSAGEANETFGFRFGGGSYCSVLIKPDISDAGQQPDVYQILMQHCLEIVRREVSAIASEWAADIWREGIAVILNAEEYQMVDVKQCLTRIRKEIEKQRDLFWDIRIAVLVGCPYSGLEHMTDSMREALWLCRDRICKNQAWRFASSEPIDFTHRYRMDSSQKKRFQEAAEYRNAEQFERELTESFHLLLQEKNLNGQMVEDWFHEVVSVCVFAMEDNRKDAERTAQELEEDYWFCTSVQEVYTLLLRIRQKIEQVNREKASQEARPITQAKRYIQEHFQEPLRLEDVSSIVGFNATYFSTLFKKETGQNFVDYLTELRINKAKELLCEADVSVSDAAELVGYRDLKYFSRLFKKTTGISPSDYKKLYR